MIPECYVPAVLQLIYDGVIAGDQGKERTLTAARTNYYWPTMRVDIDFHVSKSVICVQNKGTGPRPAPIFGYPPLINLGTLSL